MWEVLQQLVYQLKIQDVEHLKEVSVSHWEQISEHLIDRTVGQFRK